MLGPTPRQKRHPDLEVEQILTWADAHHARTGRWPTRNSGIVLDAPREKWANLAAALRRGERGLPPGPTLAQLLAQHRGVRNHLDRPKLSVAQVLAWADAHHARTGEWPTKTSGVIPAAPEEKWSAIDAALGAGNRGLPRDSSLARLLAQHRGVRNPKGLPPFTEAEILAWADAYRTRQGRWPQVQSGPIEEAPGETWAGVESALQQGKRGLLGGSSLARLLARERGARNPRGLLKLSEATLLTWADAHHARTGQWPTRTSGPVPEAPGEVWSAVDHALVSGYRGLPGGSSLARLLAERRGARYLRDLPPLTVEQILAWADAHHARTGRWPRGDSGGIPESPSESWAAVNTALQHGGRGLPGGSSLTRLLAENVGPHAQRCQRAPELEIGQILAWADAHFARTGRWPRQDSGPVADAPHEKWYNVDAALREGTRGLQPGSSLARLLDQSRGVRNRKALPPLAQAQILAWADAYFQRHGKWPASNAGPVAEAPGETWMAVDMALINGLRGLPGDSSLAQLLSRHRGVRNRQDLPPLTEAQILAWADAFHAREGRWPTARSGAIQEAPGESWNGVHSALSKGFRGFPGGSSLPRLLAARRDKRHPQDQPHLTLTQILTWAEAHHARTGQWPTRASGPVPEDPGTTWTGVDLALKRGHRGLPGGSSLAQLLAEQRGVRNRAALPDLTEAQILAWADAHHRRTGQWPTRDSGAIEAAPEETWSAVNTALHKGLRGLRGGSSLAQLLRSRHRSGQNGSGPCYPAERDAPGKVHTGERIASREGVAPGSKDAASAWSGDKTVGDR